VEHGDFKSSPQKTKRVPRKKQKKQGATGITTVAPYVAGQWGRGEDRLF